MCKTSIASRKLLYNTEGAQVGAVMTYRDGMGIGGRFQEGGDIHIHIAD